MPVQAPDSWFKRASRGGVALLAILVLGVGLVACGGDDEESSSDSTSTPAATSTGGGAAATATSASGGNSTSGTPVATEKGTQIANAAMLVVADLPGTTWRQTATDEFGGSLLDTQDSDLEQTPACNAYVKKITDAAKKAQESLIGRASRSFQQEGDLFGVSIDAEVGVYKDSKVATALISEAKGAFGSKDFENCFREVIKGNEGEIPDEVKFDLKAGKAATSAPHGGVAQAFDISLSSAGVNFTLHAELYAWADKNATALITVFGSPEEIKAEVVKAAVEKTDQKLSKAQ